MGVWAKIGWGALGLLVAAGVAAMFLLHWAMGLAFALFTAGVLWWVFGVLKKRVDARIRQTAGRLGLACRPHPFRYASMQGEFRGHPVRVSYESSRAFAAGSALAAATGSPGWAGLDVRSLTAIRLEHGGRERPGTVVEAGPPPVLAKGGELVLALPDIVDRPEPLRAALERLAVLAQGPLPGAPAG